MAGTPETAAAAVDEAARSAVASACGEVADAGPADHVDGARPALVARPGSTEETAEVMKAAAAHGLAAVARGRGTKMTWGRPPRRADLVVDLSRMDQVLDHAAGDLVVGAQAGTRLADVQEAVGEAGQRLAVDEVVPGASIGGTLATGTSGPGRVSTGTVRDLLIGVTVVRADGTVAKAGGRVVKNVAGYDLGKLVIGSYGTLAVVTEALFRLHPRPAARRFVTVPVADSRAAHDLAQAVVHSQVVPSAVEVDWPAEGGGTLTVLHDGILPAGVEGRASATLGLLGPSATEQEEAPDGWAAYPWPVDAAGDDRATALKLTFALSGLRDVLSAAEGAGVPVHLRGSAGTGVVHAAIPAGTDPAAVAAAVERLRGVCRQYGGSVVVLDAATGVKEVVDTWGPVNGLDLMRRVKAQFDPENRLAPGRFVGGI
ncbi:MAG TPA: FAD-binding oxidoreductase [Nocardioidaceae bacterium]